MRVGYKGFHCIFFLSNNWHSYPVVVTDVVGRGCHEEAAARHFDTVQEAFATSTVRVGVVNDHATTCRHCCLHAQHALLPRAQCVSVKKQIQPLICLEK